MKFKGLENDCFLRLVASRESGLNLSGTRLMILWAANSETYNITNQQLAHESGMKASNVSRELKLLCEAEWLVGQEIRRNKWDQPVTKYTLHPKRWKQIQEMAKEYKGEKNAEDDELIKPEETKPSEGQQLNALEQYFNDFVLKYNLKDKPSRLEHGNDVCKLFFLDVKSKNTNLADLEVLKSKYIGLFCHKSKKMADQQFEEWRSELSASWDRCLKDVFGEQILKVLNYIPNSQNLSLIESMFTETDWLNAYNSWVCKYNGASLEEFKKLYTRDLDIEIRSDPTNNIVSAVSQTLEVTKSNNQRFALAWAAKRLEQKSTQITEAMPKQDNISQTSKKHRDAIVDGDRIITEHLSYDIPSEDDEGDPYYIPPEERINLKPEDCAPMQYDEEFCSRIGATKDRR